jgi:hypothetical protein
LLLDTGACHSHLERRVPGALEYASTCTAGRDSLSETSPNSQNVSRARCRSRIP